MTYLHRSLARREFLRRATHLSAMVGTPFAASLLAAGAASAQTAGDHKALVCIFLAGGNDQSNTVVPMGGGYANYQLARPSLALPLANLRALNPVDYTGNPLGLHPSLAALQTLFDQQRVALVANVGTLAVPITKTQWNAGHPSVAVPTQLFSHSDQQGAWQTGVPDAASQTGWQGRMGDLLASTYNGSSNAVSIAMSLAGNNIMQSGDSTVQYQLTTDGAVRVAALDGLYASATGANVVRQLMSQSRSHVLENELNRISGRAIGTEAVVRNALNGVTVGGVIFPATPLGRQLQMVARMVAARGVLGQRRQLFFVQQGGYDFHDKLIDDQGRRLQELGDAMAAFYLATANLGVTNQVTSFTASDFGRALQHNGRGSDHGWGGHHFVMGGAVQGNRVYGRFPTVALGGPEDAGQGRLIPSTSVDEYTATLARWFGVPLGSLSTVLPNIGRFVSRDLGFMGSLL